MRSNHHISHANILKPTTAQAPPLPFQAKYNPPTIPINGKRTATNNQMLSTLASFCIVFYFGHILSIFDIY